MNWNYHINVLNTFATHRSDCVKQHIQDYFNLGAIHELTLDVEPAGCGTIQVNTIEIDDFSWQGEYFEGIPITLTAIPAPDINSANGRGHAAWSLKSP